MPSLNTGNAILSNPIKVDSSYNVGIGGAASGSFKLQVTGTTNLTGALSGTSATFSGAVQGDFLVVGTTAATSGGLRLGTQVAIRARNVANTANIPLIESTASDGVSVSNGALILASTGAATFSSSLSVLNGVVVVDASSSSRSAINIKNTGNGADIGIENASGTYFGGPAYSLNFQTANYPMLFWTNNTERMRITSGGTVTIQTPTTGVALLANGKASEWAGQFQGINSTSVSFGVKINAGTNSSDAALLIKNAADSADYFRITGAGIITTPTQVSFKAYLSANTERGKGSVIIVPYDVEAYDTQGNFSTSTYKFTAPVAGKYLFTVNFNAYSLDDTAFLRVMLYRNSTDIRNLYVIQNMPTGNTGDISISGSDIIDLGAGDTVDVRIITDGSGSFGMSRDLVWNSFSGHLL